MPGFVLYCNFWTWHDTSHKNYVLGHSASCKKKLAQYSLYGHHGRSNEKTEEDLVRGSEKEEKERVTEQDTKQ